METFSKWINTPIIHVGDTPVTFGGIGSAMVVFFVVLIVSAIVQRVVSNYIGKRMQVANATLYAIRRILHYVFVCVAIVLAAQCVGLNFGTLAVAFGFLGVGIGLGLQNITANFVSGLILLLERPVRIGDLINIDGKISEVIGINMRVTVVRTFDNVTVLVPNTKLVENEVVNWTVDDPRTRIHCPVGVAYGSDTTKVKEVLLTVAKNHKDVLEKPEPEVRFLEFGDSSLNFDLLVWTSKPENQKILRSDINFMIDAAFREHDIKIPFPQRDIHLQMTPAVEKLSESKEAR